MRPRRPVVVLVAALLVSSSAAGCGAAATRADAAGALQSVSDHLDQAGSAVATAQLAVEEVAAGRMPRVTADVAVAGAVETATTAAHGVASLVVPDVPPAAPRARQQALEAVSSAVAAVTEARVAVGGPRHSVGTRQALTSLGDAADALGRARTAVERTAEAAS